MNDAAVREHLLYLLRGGGAHLHFDQAIADIPPAMQCAKVASCPHTLWRLLEHMRIAQWDILEFCRNPQHVSPDYPDGYWPEGYGPSDSDQWDRAIESFRADLSAMQDLVANTATDLLAPIPHADGQTILREAILIADHNAYHLGQVVMLRRCLGIWPEE